MSTLIPFNRPGTPSVVQKNLCFHTRQHGLLKVYINLAIIMNTVYNQNTIPHVYSENVHKFYKFLTLTQSLYFLHNYFETLTNDRIEDRTFGVTA